MKCLYVVAALFVLAALPAEAQYALQFGAATAAGDGEIFVGEGRNLMQPGSVFHFVQDAQGNWVDGGALKPSDTSDAADGFGRSMDLDGSTLVVGASMNDAVYVFEKSGSAWVESGRIAPGIDGFGAGIELRGDRMLVTSSGSRQAPGGRPRLCPGRRRLLECRRYAGSGRTRSV